MYLDPLKALASGDIWKTMTRALLAKPFSLRDFPSSSQWLKWQYRALHKTPIPGVNSQYGSMMDPSTDPMGFFLFITIPRHRPRHILR